MTASGGVRAAALGAVAVVTVVVALLVGNHFHHTKAAPTVPWYTAFATPYAPSATSTKSACGQVIGEQTIGVAHPVLPCGVKLEIQFGGRHAIARVIDRSHPVPGHTFDLTPALARELGLDGTQSIQWRFAR